jgi:RNA polymerase sigma-70 factor, ECF subfamily
MKTRIDPETPGDHLDRLFRAAWALCGSRHDAEELVRETYTRVLARPRLVRRESDLGYLLRALRNTFLARAGASEPPVAEAAPEVFAAIAALPAEGRDALVAIDIAGLSYAEAAKALRVDEGTITSRLFRARRELATGSSALRPRRDAETRANPAHRVPLPQGPVVAALVHVEHEVWEVRLA